MAQEQRLACAGRSAAEGALRPCRRIDPMVPFRSPITVAAGLQAWAATGAGPDPALLEPAAACLATGTAGVRSVPPRSSPVQPIQQTCRQLVDVRAHHARLVLTRRCRR